MTVKTNANAIVQKIFHRFLPNELLPSTPRSGLLAILC